MLRNLFTLIAVVFTVFALPACPKQQFFPTCDDPLYPCPPDPEYLEADVDGVGTEAGNACRQLRALRCSEGYRDERTGRTCYQRLTSHAELADVPYACMRAAHSAEDVRRCGSDSTLRFRCFAPTSGQR